MSTMLSNTAVCVKTYEGERDESESKRTPSQNSQKKVPGFQKRLLQMEI